MKQEVDSLKREMIDKLLTNLTKMREKTQINKIRNAKGEITTNITEIQGIRDNSENTQSSKWEKSRRNG
jgi:hypothetical protein